uniref:Uncharacterized protein n=1 Tax=Heliothis virescens TaxID=7102 RepID=A0A2A4JSB6_HELVI
MEVPRYRSYYPCEGGNGVNYHVQYVTEPQEIYTQGHQTHMEPLRYPVYGVATVGAEGTSADSGWGGASSAEYTAYGVVVSTTQFYVY